jgi:DNA-binding NarL/FixJ family response regulator
VPKARLFYIGAGETSGEQSIARTTIDPRVANLPPRLRNLLHRLLEGDSEKEAANRLKLSRHTVHQYVKMLYAELEVSSRAELMARCLRQI